MVSWLVPLSILFILGILCAKQDVWTARCDALSTEDNNFYTIPCALYRGTESQTKIEHV